jgi:hypothetical protein
MYVAPGYPWNRRQWLRAGVASSVGLSLPGLWQAWAAAEEVRGPEASRQADLGPPIRSCIFIFYYGGPSHLDTFDLKPNAPAEVRGEFQPIATSVPGLQIGEHLPRMAGTMHRVALIRSLHHANRLHDSASIETFTGRPSPNGDREEFSPIPQFFPSHGAILSHLWRERALDVPNAALPFLFHNVIPVPCQGGGFLGSAHDPLLVEALPDQRSYRCGIMETHEDVPERRLLDRRALLDQLESGPVALGTHQAARQVRRFYDKALTLMSSESLRQALAIERESEATRQRYGFFDPPAGGGGTGAENGLGRQMRGQNLLLARRLVEAGVPFVTVADFRQQGQNWDSHANAFPEQKNYLLPQMDQALSALIEDLDQRGLLDSTLVVALGEFGRTPTINRVAGRDHWPDCYTALLAGGGAKGGYVLGASDKLGAYPDLDPVTPADLAATIFWRFGIDPATLIHDLTGRPYHVAEGRPLTRLFTDAA